MAPTLALLDAGAAAGLMTAGLRLFLVAWSFALGASFGSFLNVVVYRLPAGLNLSRPKSRCPRCETPIRSGDNVPVLGWLRLRGRCRACGLPIAARYPLVEAAAGALLAGLALLVVLLGGPNLPVETNAAAGPGAFARSIDPELVALCGTLFVGPLTLLGTGLVSLDGHRPPAKLWGTGLALAVAAAAVWPGVRSDPPVWERHEVGGATTRWSLAAGRPAPLAVAGVPFAPDWRGPADAALSATLLAAAVAFPAALTGGGRRAGWGVVAAAALAGGWFGVRAGGWGLAVGGAAWLLAPVGLAAGAVRGRVPGGTWAAFGAAAVPLLWAWAPKPAGWADPAAGPATAAAVLTAAALLDRAFFGTAAAPSEPAPAAAEADARPPPTLPDDPAGP